MSTATATAVPQTFTPRPYQVDAIEALRKGWAAGTNQASPGCFCRRHAPRLARRSRRPTRCHIP
ncbi:hypothetical protein, partial [Streptomyces sp. NPDC056540]|uniref:hypothetical protein n=1 Tax=Streptomyces sp. NPDC056540 TaxID=3345859 RepID=UPI0036A8DC9C